VTTLLDAAGLVLVAAGLGVAAGYLVGWAGLTVTGAVILAGSWWAARPAGAPSGGAQ
jgi:hypothetical protein